MSNPPLTQKDILSLCGRAGGFSILTSHAHFENHMAKLSKLAEKGLVRMSKRLGDNGGVFVSV